ncbi:MAG: hypothetical protein O3C40_06920 [Planctomycetota bacterium]|nr:hypothetical protein [Planctomycetota bacterium]
MTGTDETWAGINHGLSQGYRGLPGGSSLAKLLAEHCGVRNIHDLSPLTVEQILQWVDEHRAATGEWPNRTSREVTGTDETWHGINHALRQGNRGLSGGSTLSGLLAEHRGTRNRSDLPPLTIEQILVWADEHRAVTGEWPQQKSGKVIGTDETWAGIQFALSKRRRALHGGSSLARLLAEHRGVRNTMELSPLTIEQILFWVDEYRAGTGDWPKYNSGRVRGTDETWSGIDFALVQGRRGLPGGSSLAKQLAEHRSVRNIKDLPPLTTEQILVWADEHRAATGDWPQRTSGKVTGTDENWSIINNALQQGIRGIPGGSSLAKLLAEHRGTRNHLDLAPLTIEQILVWADEHSATTGDWPKKASGNVLGTDETWGGINFALRRGRRELPGGSSLANLLAERRRVRNVNDLPPLTIEQILIWVDEHRAATGEWPKPKSGPVPGTDEMWKGIDVGLTQGQRGLPGGSSLGKLLAEHRGVRNLADLAPLTISQILIWVDEHRATTGEWPKQKSGKVTGTDETWVSIDNALKGGSRELPGDSSLAKLLDEHRGVRNIHGLPPLTIEQILVWADEHKAATGEWPKQTSGPVTGTDEVWKGINFGLREGRRGLPGRSSLAKLLAEYRGVRKITHLAPLTIEQILVWVGEYRAATGEWPNPTSGGVPGTDEMWKKIDRALREGRRGLPSGSSLSKLVDRHR